MLPKSSDESWVMCPSPNPQALLRLFCFPYAGGGASIFRTWSADLPPAVEVCSVQLPGRESRLVDAPFTRLEPLVQKLASALSPCLGKPFAFFGHSMGALVSFELARRLRQQYDVGPRHLFVSAHKAPQLPDQHAPIHHLPAPEFLEELRNLKGTPEVVLQHEELMQLVLPALRADFAVCETYIYSYQEPLACPISAFGGVQDEEVKYDELKAWQNQTKSAFTLRMLPGDHFFLHSAHVSLLRALSEDLTRLLGCVAKNQGGMRWA